MVKSAIKFTRTRYVTLPVRGHIFDAGIDFFVPSFDKQFIEDLKKKNPDVFEIPVEYASGYSLIGSGLTIQGGSISVPKVEFDLTDENDSLFKMDDEKGENYFLLAPLGRINIPSGIYCQMAESGRALIAANKSGVASKQGLIFGAQVVDFEYQGEIHINVINTSSKVVRIYEGQKLIQFLETPIFTSPIEEVDTLQNLYKGATSRADGGFGSTDKKDAQQLNS